MLVRELHAQRTGKAAVRTPKAESSLNRNTAKRAQTSATTSREGSESVGLPFSSARWDSRQQCHCQGAYNMATVSKNEGFQYLQALQGED